MQGLFSSLVPTHVKLVAAVVVFVAVLLAPANEGLSPEGQRVLAVVGFSIVLWTTEAVPMAVAGLAAVVLLVVVGAVPDVSAALYGFSRPVAYFLIGVLAIGLAVLKTGLAERLARYLVTRSRGSTAALFAQMCFSFAALAFILPSAITRGGILIPVYEQILGMLNVGKGAPLAKALMLGLTALNRLGSNALLTGGVTPVAAAALLGGVSWSRWFAFMSVPQYLLLLFGGMLVYLLHQPGPQNWPETGLERAEVGKPRQGFSANEVKVAAIAGGASLLWLADFIHHWDPAIPALMALVVLLSPGIGVLSWREFERDIGWSTFVVLGSSLSLAQALVTSGAAAWFAQGLVAALAPFTSSPLLIAAFLMVVACAVRTVVPNIAAFLALLLPVSMALAVQVGLNPFVVGMLVTATGDAIVYYPAQGTTAIMIFERGHLKAWEVLRVGLGMTVLAFLILLFIALPYWGILGEPLTK